MNSPSNGEAKTGLARELNLRDFVFLIVGTVIGSGIFLVPGLVLESCSGNGYVAIGVWLCGGLLCLAGALTFAELSTAQPDAGGLYVFLRDAYGSLVAFLYGWALLLVIGSGTVAALTVAFRANLLLLVPQLQAASPILPAVAIAILSGINIRGIRSSARLQNAATAWKLTFILGMAAVLLATGSWVHLTDAASASQVSASGIGAAAVSVLWAYEGWQHAAQSAGEVQDPRRTLARGFLWAMVILIVTYVAANLGYVAALGITATIASKSAAADAVSTVLGPVAGSIVAATILVSVLGAANGMITTTPRVYMAMAADGLFFRRLAEIHPKTRTPIAAIVVAGAWAAVLSSIGTFQELLSSVVFAGWAFYALGAGAVVVLRRRNPSASRSYSVPGYPYTPAVFVLGAVALVVGTIIRAPLRSLLGIAVVLSGVPAFYIFIARQRPSRQSDDTSTAGGG